MDFPLPTDSSIRFQFLPSSFLFCLKIKKARGVPRWRNNPFRFSFVECFYFCSSLHYQAVCYDLVHCFVSLLAGMHQWHRKPNCSHHRLPAVCHRNESMNMLISSFLWPNVIIARVAFSNFNKQMPSAGLSCARLFAASMRDYETNDKLIDRRNKQWRMKGTIFACPTIETILP